MTAALRSIAARAAAGRARARPAAIRGIGATLAGLVAAATLQAEPRWYEAAAAAAAERSAAVGTASAADPEAGAIEGRVQSIERLSKRDPQRALAELAVLNRTGLSARGQLRLAVANARIATMQYRMQEALPMIDAALPSVRRLGDPALLSKLLVSRASALHEMNRGAEALAAGEEARALAERTHDDELRVDTRIFLVDYAARRGDYERAFAQLEEAEQIARRHGAPGLLAVVAYTGASLSKKIDDLPAAIDGYRAAEPAFRADGDPLAEADSARGLAGLLVNAERHTEALDLLQRALARYHALDDDFGIAVATALMARAMLGSGRADQAFELNDAAIAALRTAGLSDTLAVALIDRVELKLASGQTPGTAALLDEARALLLRSDELSLRMRFQRVAAAAYSALGRHREAHAALLDLLQLRERHDDQRLSRQLAAQRGRLDSQRMAADLERARREGEEHRAALDQAKKSARLQTALGLLAGLALLVALIFLVRIMRRGQRHAALARTDFLTGIQNRRRITELGQQLLDAARERGDAISVLLLDLDHFKSINDDFGHQTGDRALKAVADELKRHLRSGDELGRYGGEEFAVVLPATSAERAAVIAERLRAAIARLKVDTLGLDRPLTVSVGVASAAAEREFGELVARADGGLYSAKQSGRDRIAVADDDAVNSISAGVPGRAVVVPIQTAVRAALNTTHAQPK